MISRNPSGSMIGVTHSDSDAWLACDADILDLWPGATGYAYVTAFDGWPNWRGPNVALLWEVFGPECPGPHDSVELASWGRVPGAVRRAQHVFLLPDVLDVQPLLIYRCIYAPDPGMVKTAVLRATRIAEADRQRQQAKHEQFGRAPFDQEAPEGGAS